MSTKAWGMIPVVGVLVTAFLLMLLSEPPLPESSGEVPDMSLSEPRAGSAGQSKEDSGPARAVARDLLTGGTADGVLVHGSVTDQDGPVEEALTLDFSREGSGGVSTSVREGAYSVENLASGLWKVTVRGSLYGLDETLDVPSVEVWRRDLVLAERPTLRVFFDTPEGRRLAQEIGEAELWDHGYEPVYAVASRLATLQNLPLMSAREWRSALSRWAANSDLRGRDGRVLDGSPDGVLHLTGPLPFYVHAMLRHRVVASEFVIPGTADVHLQIDLQQVRDHLGAVRVRPVDALTRQAITASLSVGTLGHYGVGGRRRTADDGSLVIDHVEPGLVRAQVSAEGYGLFSKVLRVGAGETVDLGYLEMNRALSLEGVVVDGEGNPVTGRIYWDALDVRDFPQPVRSNEYTATGPAGEFTLVGLRPAPYSIRAVGPTDSFGAVVTDLRQLQDTVRIQVEPTTEVVLEWTIREPAQRTVLVLDRERLPVWGEVLNGPPRTGLHLPPGQFTLEVHSGPYLIQRELFVVGASRLRLAIH